MINPHKEGPIIRVFLNKDIKEKRVLKHIQGITSFFISTIKMLIKPTDITMKLIALLNKLVVSDKIHRPLKIIRGENLSATLYIRG